MPLETSLTQGISMELVVKPLNVNSIPVGNCVFEPNTSTNYICLQDEQISVLDFYECPPYFVTIMFSLSMGGCMCSSMCECVCVFVYAYEVMVMRMCLCVGVWVYLLIYVDSFVCA